MFMQPHVEFLNYGIMEVVLEHLERTLAEIVQDMYAVLYVCVKVCKWVFVLFYLMSIFGKMIRKRNSRLDD